MRRRPAKSLMDVSGLTRTSKVIHSVLRLLIKRQMRLVVAKLSVLHNRVVLYAVGSDPTACLPAIETLMIKTRKLVFWLVLILVICIPLAVWLYHQMLIDKCLDAGGAWDYQHQQCVYEKSQK